MSIWIQVFLAIPKFIEAFTAFMGFVHEQQEKKRQEDLEKLKEDIKNAKSEDDFRNAAGKL